MIRAVIFDYYGVIRNVDVRKACRQLGGDPVADNEFIETIIERANKGEIPSPRAYFAKRLGVDVATWARTVLGDSANDRELLRYIKKLRSQGLKTGLLTNMMKGGLAMMFEPGEVDAYFDAAISSGDIGFIKPSPQAYGAILSQLQVAPAESVMVDDQASSCDGARAVGMYAIEYKSVEQLQRALGTLLQLSVA